MHHPRPNLWLAPLRGCKRIALVLALGCAAPIAGESQVLIDPWTVNWGSTEDGTSLAWLDRTQQGLHSFLARSARSIDGLAGPPAPRDVYLQASGSIAVAMLWDEFHGVEPKVRFHVDLPLPQINERLHFFIGRLNRDEFVTERDEPSGAFPRLGRSFNDDEDQTLAGFAYRRPGRHGGDFGAGLGARVRSGSLDPYVKVAYTYRRAFGRRTMLALKETLFYQLSEEFGLTSRVDVERLLGESWWARWRASATISEQTAGVRGFTNLTFVRALSEHRSLAFRVSAEGDTSAEVPLQDFGVEAAFRRTVLRDWLVLELRTGLSWPKEERDAPRESSWGFGVGCEMYFGGEGFSIQPMTF